MFDHAAGISNPAYIEEDRFLHWSPSQAYASADVLIHYLREGWALDPLAEVETYYFAGCRRVDIFYFRLRRNIQTLEMPVLANPVVTRLIRDCDLTTCPRPFGKST